MSRTLKSKLPVVLAEHLEKNKMTVQDLAEIAGIAEQTLYGSLRKNRSMSLKNAFKILKVFYSEELAKCKDSVPAFKKINPLLEELINLGS